MLNENQIFAFNGGSIDFELQIENRGPLRTLSKEICRKVEVKVELPIKVVNRKIESLIFTDTVMHHCSLMVMLDEVRRIQLKYQNSLHFNFSNQRRHFIFTKIRHRKNDNVCRN